MPTPLRRPAGGHATRRIAAVLAGAAALVAVAIAPVGAGGATPTCSDAGIARDGWFKVPPPPVTTWVVGATVFGGAPCALLAADSGGHVFVTGDTGRHWRLVTTLPLGDGGTGCVSRLNRVVGENLVGGTAYVLGAPKGPQCAGSSPADAASATGLWVTHDFGASFSPVPAFAGLNVLSVTASVSDARTMYALAQPAVTVDPLVAATYASTDGGATWAVVPTAAALMPTRLAVGATGTTPAPVWAAGLANSATGANDVGKEGLWVSTNGGQTFAQATQESNLYDLSTSVRSPGVDQLDVATSDGILRTANDGRTFRRLAAGAGVTAVRAEAAAPRALMAIMEGTVVRSVDDGMTFDGTGLGSLGACTQTLTRDHESPSLFALVAVASPLSGPGTPFGECRNAGIWLYRSSGADLAAPTGPVDSGIDDGLAADVASCKTGPPGAPTTGGTAAPPGTVVYVDNFTGNTCLVAFDRYGNAANVAAMPLMGEGIATDFDGRLLISSRYSGELIRFAPADGRTSVIDPNAVPVEGPSFDRYGNLYITLNDSNHARAGVWEYPFPQLPGAPRRLVWSFGRRFIEDTKVAPPGSPYAGDVFVLYASDPRSIDCDAVAVLHRTARGWVRRPDFISHLPASFAALGIAFMPDGSLLVPDYRGSGRVLRYDRTGAGPSVFADTATGGHSYVFMKIDVAADGYVYLTSASSSEGGLLFSPTPVSNALVRLDPAGRHLLPDFTQNLTAPVGVAVRNVITGLPRLPLPGAPRQPVAPTGVDPPRGVAPPPVPPVPPPPPLPVAAPGAVAGPAAAPAPGPAAQANANPASQAQGNPQPVPVSQRQEQLQLATVHAATANTNGDGQLSMVGLRVPAPDAALAGWLGGLVCAALAVGHRPRERVAVARVPVATARPRRPRADRRRLDRGRWS
jgi:hypothetical protein